LSLRPSAGAPTAALVVAAIGPIAISGILVPIRDEILTTNAALVLVVVVLLAALLGGRLTGAIAALVSAICFDFFFTRPYYSFRISSPDDLETAILLLVVGLVVGELTVRSRRYRASASESGREVERTRRVAELGAGGERSGTLIHAVEREVVDVLDARGVHYERPPFPTKLAVVGHDGISVPAPGSDPPIGPPNEVAIPVYGRGRELGRFVVVLKDGSSALRLTPADRALVVVLADQLGAAIASARSPE
jgi:Domain of unknown function (DUF4118)